MTAKKKLPSERARLDALVKKWLRDAYASGGDFSFDHGRVEALRGCARQLRRVIGRRPTGKK